MLFPHLFPFADALFLKAPKAASVDVAARAPSDLPLILGAVAVIVGVLYVLLLLRKSSEPPQKNWVVVDGSNVMHWRNQVPQIETVRAVIFELTLRGYCPGVVFDANAGHKLFGRYKGDRALGQMVGLPEDRVFVVPKGTQADPFLLESAKDLHARIVTNDRFRDWADTHPEVRKPGFLIRGGYRDSGELWLDDKVTATADRA